VRHDKLDVQRQLSWEDALQSASQPGQHKL